MPAQLAPGRIIWAEVPDAAGRNPKRRPIVVLRHQDGSSGQVEVIGVFVTSTLPQPLPDDYVPLPWHRDRRVRTGLGKPSAAVCSIICHLTFTNVGEIAMGGFVDGRLLETIVAKVNKLNPSRGGEAARPGTAPDSGL